MFQALNPLTIPIADTNLIEASAGTGKTWSIAALFTRLVLLEQYRVDKILVVTFTKAATAELKTRLRARLDEALRVLEADDAEDFDLLKQNCMADEFLFDLLQRALQKESRARLQLRLKAAISEFDNAAIYTIHGFCQRVLQDFAFLCHVPFDIQLDEQIGENQQLIAAQDFWRTRVAHDDVLAELTYRHNITPQSLLAELKSFLARPYLVFRQPEQPNLPYSVLVANFQAAWANIQQNLHEIEAAFWAIRPVLNGNNYRVNTFTKKFTELKKLPEKPNLLKLKEILYSSNKIDLPFSLAFMQEKNTGKGTLDMQKALIVSQLNDLVAHIDEILLAEQAILQTLSHDFIRYLREQHQELKKRTPQRVFDDLLLDVYTALLHNPEHASTLSASLANSWQVALIDEFQDTDPLQYAIFRTVFAQTPLFLVGDPKQAIYSFRGADIFAYLDAAQHSQHHFTLETNRRSHRRLMNSISAWFQRPQPFVLPNIHYQAVNAFRVSPDIFRQPENAEHHAMNIHWLPNPNKDRQETLVKRAANLCANHIADLLNRDVHIKDKALHAGQIAVLVQTRKEGALVQHELKKRRIQSVLLSKNNIFAEAEAEAISALLAWLIQPQKTGLLRFVLASCLFEYDAEQLHELNQNEKLLLAWIDDACNTLAQWQKSGIYAALQQFMTQHHVETRLLAQQNERTLTNLHQIMELLAKEDELSHSPSSLQQWLSQQVQAARSRPVGESEHNTLRLESDENLVKIVTMHASKGLEYPIVFCPFVWRDKKINNKDKWFISHHNQQAELIHKAQYQTDEHFKQNVQDEHLSENLRLLYVAMTRAREELHLYLTHSADCKNSAISYLLQADEAACKDAASYYAVLSDFVNKQNATETDFHLLSDEDHYQESVHLLEPSARTDFQATVFPERRFYFVQHASFTSLSRQTEKVAAELLPVLDFDEQSVASTQNDTNADGIFAFPRGVAAGVCLHTIFEHLLFQQSAHSQTDTICDILNQHGFDADLWGDTIATMCESARQTPLLPHANLANVPHILSEMNFLLHEQSFKLRDIQNFMANPRFRLPESIVQAAQNLHFHDVNGFLNGAIDLVAQTQQGDILIVDYKSNYLGNHADAYQVHALNEAIAEHHYYLQALIYAIATARYLQSRQALPKMLHIRYLFLRGLDGISDNGVWAWDIATEDLSIWLNN